MSIRFDKVMIWNEEGIGVIAINNKDENLLDADVLTQMTTALTIANNDNDVNWIVITGTGTRFFTAGIPWDAVAPSYAAVKELIKGVKALVSVMSVLDKPIIVILNGSAIGLGMELALISDLVIASPDVYMCYPEGSVGIPMPLGSKIVVDRLPRFRAIGVLTGSPLAASEAANYGILHTVNRENLFGEAKSLIKGLRISPMVRRQLSQWIRGVIDAIDSLYLDAVSSALLDQGKRDELIKAVKGARLRCFSRYRT